MESSSSASAINNSARRRRPSSSSILLTTFITLFLLLLSSFFFSTTHHHHHLTKPKPKPPPLSPIIKTTCNNTLYPSLCFQTLSALPLQRHHTTTTTTTLRHVLEFTIERTIKRVTKNRFKMVASFGSQHLNLQQSSWFDNCIELLDQTLYELQEAITQLYDQDQDQLQLRLPYANIKTLLSAAMTNQNTCIDGFSDLELKLNTKSNKRFRHHVQKSLTPIIRMISNCLAILKYMEMETFKNPSLFMTTSTTHHDSPYHTHTHTPSWMTTGDRKLMEIQHAAATIQPNIVVAMDGTGNYTSINDAVSMAPDRSTGRYVIQIKAGIYNENVVIPRHKANIMLVGQGMNLTVIKGSKNVVDGFPTFNSATLTVVGNRFLARDLTIINTSGPEKHQAVALRVTSNAAFYHCQFISHQDTLYAHSLSQLYRECAIQGTIDFIFGNAAAIFQRCLILVRKPIPGQKNVITAQGRLDPNQNTGISLQDCTIMAAPDFPIAERANFSTFLGRPWRNYSRTIVMKSYLGDLIDPRGWCSWNEYSNLATVEYIEYMNFGPGADTRNRVRWAGYQNNSSRDVEKFTIEAFLHGADDWLKSTDYPFSVAHLQEIVQGWHCTSLLTNTSTMTCSL